MKVQMEKMGRKKDFCSEGEVSVLKGGTIFGRSRESKCVLVMMCICAHLFGGKKLCVGKKGRWWITATRREKREADEALRDRRRQMAAQELVRLKRKTEAHGFHGNAFGTYRTGAVRVCATLSPRTFSFFNLHLCFNFLNPLPCIFSLPYKFVSFHLNEGASKKG